MNSLQQKPFILSQAPLILWFSPVLSNWCTFTGATEMDTASFLSCPQTPPFCTLQGIMNHTKGQDICVTKEPTICSVKICLSVLQWIWVPDRNVVIYSTNCRSVCTGWHSSMKGSNLKFSYWLCCWSPTCTTGIRKVEMHFAWNRMTVMDSGHCAPEH